MTNNEATENTLRLICHDEIADLILTTADRLLHQLHTSPCFPSNSVPEPNHIANANLRLKLLTPKLA